MAYGNYHSGAPTLSFTLAYSFAKDKKTNTKTTDKVQPNTE
jgi:hypothetical protein